MDWSVKIIKEKNNVLNDLGKVLDDQRFNNTKTIFASMRRMRKKQKKEKIVIIKDNRMIRVFWENIQ